MIDEKLPKSITLDDVLHHRRWILELVDKFGMDIPDDIDGREFKEYWEQYCEHPHYTTNYYFAEAIRKGLNKYLIKKDEKVNECGVQGGATPANVGGMGDIVLPGGEPGSGSPGSGDIPLPSPTGKVYTQVQPFDQFIKKNWKNRKIKKSKRKRRLEKNSDAEHTPNAPVYDYVDDFRTYAQRTQNNLNG